MAQAQPGGTGAVLRRSLRGAMYGLVPILAFYVAYRLGGVGWAVGIGSALTVAVFPFERRATGSMRWSWIGLAGVALGAVLALVTRDPKLFFLRAVIGDAAWGLAMLGSLAIRRPLIGVFASWVVHIPDEYKETREYRRSFGLVTLVWGVVNVARAIGRGYLLAQGTLEQFVLVQLLTGWPVFAVLLIFSVWYPRRVARRYVVSLGVDESMVDQILLGGVEQARAAEVATGAED